MPLLPLGPRGVPPPILVVLVLVPLLVNPWWCSLLFLVLVLVETVPIRSGIRGGRPFTLPWPSLATLAVLGWHGHWHDPLII